MSSNNAPPPATASTTAAVATSGGGGAGRRLATSLATPPSATRHITFNELISCHIMSSMRAAAAASSSMAVNTTQTMNINDLKLNGIQEPTTPIDKLNTPCTVSVRHNAFFPPSPNPIGCSESGVDLTIGGSYDRKQTNESHA